MSKVLGVSRNTVAEIQALYEASDMSWDELCNYDDDMLYEFVLPG